VGFSPTNQAIAAGMVKSVIVVAVGAVGSAVLYQPASRKVEASEDAKLMTRTEQIADGGSRIPLDAFKMSRLG
jgi:hypothetical protein